jgi:hypothetical protein
MRRVACYVAIGVLTAGCVPVRPNASYAPSMDPIWADGLAAEMVAVVRTDWSPAATTVFIEPSDRHGSAAVGGSVGDAFRLAGYAVSTSEDADLRAVHIRYLVSPLANGYLLWLRYGAKESAQLFAPNTAGGVAAVSPLTIREAR